MKVNWTAWRPRLLYGAFFVLAFLLALRQTLPAAAIKDRLVLEAAARGWELDAAEAGPAGLVGVGLRDVKLKDKAGLSVPIDELDVSLAPLPLLRGRVRVALAARVYDGTVRGAFDVTGGPRTVELQLDRVDLAQAVPLRKAAGVDLTGVASGTASLVLPADEKGQATGRADLLVAGAGLAGGKVPVPGMADGLTLPRFSLGQLAAVVKLEGGKAAFEKLSSSGGDASLASEGITVALHPRLDASSVFGRLSLKLEEAFVQKAEGKSLRGLLDLAASAGKGKDGAYHLQLFGTLGRPQARAVPPTP